MDFSTPVSMSYAKSESSFSISIFRKCKLTIIPCTDINMPKTTHHVHKKFFTFAPKFYFSLIGKEFLSIEIVRQVSSFDVPKCFLHYKSMSRINESETSKSNPPSYSSSSTIIFSIAAQQKRK